MKEQLIEFNTANLAKEKVERLKRGDKHHTKNLVFYQYHHPYYKETNGEVWLTPEEYDKRVLAHAKSTKKYKANNPLMAVVSGCIQRDIKKYKTPREDLINLDFIKGMLGFQAGRCFWFGVNLDITAPSSTRNPLKITVDRLDNKIGYSKGNVVLCCYAANCGRGNSTHNEWLKIVEIIKKGLNERVI